MIFWPEIVLAIGLIALLYAAAHDIVARTIPHSATITVGLAGVALRAADGSLPPGLLAAGAVLVAAAACWRLGWLGGGDVKLLPAAVLLLPPHRCIDYLAGVAVLGAVIALPYLCARGRLGRARSGPRTAPLLRRAWQAERFRLNRGGPLPYGAAIAAGLLLAAFGGPR